MYGCESWTIKKAERQRIDAFELWCWEKTLESPLDYKEIQPVHPKRNQSWIFIGKTDAEAPIFGHLMQRTNWLEKTLMLGKTVVGRKRGQQRMRRLDGITDSTDMNLNKKAWCAAVHRVRKSQTQLSNWTELGSIARYNITENLYHFQLKNKIHNLQWKQQKTCIYPGLLNSSFPDIGS